MRRRATRRTARLAALGAVALPVGLLLGATAARGDEHADAGSWRSRAPLGCAPATVSGEDTAPASTADTADTALAEDAAASDAIFQFAPSAAFAASLYDGPTLFAEVLRRGDFGLGATSPLEGEVIVLDGTAYHAGPTGVVEVLPPDARTPFAFVKHFRTDRRVALPATASLDDLARALDRALPSANLFYAARIDATFDLVRLRSVPPQHPPYRPLADVIAQQNVFTGEDVAGTLVGFRFPAYLAGVNATGWHFHFVDDARRLGGHVLDVRTPATSAGLDASRRLTLVLPEDAAFDAADLHDPGTAAFGAAVRPVTPASPAPPVPPPSD